MSRHRFIADLPSVSATIPATAAVCPRNNAVDAKSRLNTPCNEVVELGIQFACPSRLAIAVAKAIMLRLNVICCRLTFVFLRGQHCRTVEAHVIRTASAALRLTMALNRNGKFTDMLPLMPGSLTFIREDADAKANTVNAKKICGV